MTPEDIQKGMLFLAAAETAEAEATKKPRGRGRPRSKRAFGPPYTLLSPGTKIKVEDGIVKVVRRGKGRPTKRKVPKLPGRPKKYTDENLRWLLGRIETRKSCALSAGIGALSDSMALRLDLEEHCKTNLGYSSQKTERTIKDYLPRLQKALERARKLSY